MFQCFYPKEYADSAYSLDLQKYYDKGYRALILDVDNTLVPHGAPYDENAVAFFANARKCGFSTCIISNNGDARVRPFAEGVGSAYVAKAGKPKKDGYRKAMEICGSSRAESMFIGDQLFTDVWGANRAGIYCVLVHYIQKDTEIQIKLKRLGEKIVLYFYRRHLKRNAKLS